MTTGSARLLCGGIAAAVPAHCGGDDPYSFRYSPAVLDLSGNDVVDPPDVALWLAEPVDLDADGGADAQDLQLIVDAIGDGGSPE